MFPMTFYSADKIAEIAADPLCSVIFVVCAVIDIGTVVGVLVYSIIDDLRKKKKGDGKNGRI